MILVVFDIDGTLMNTKEVDDTCFINSLKECWNCDLKEVDWSNYKNVTDTGLAKDIFKEFFKKEINESELHNLKKIFYSKINSEADRHPQKFREIEGATRFIRNLKSKNIAISFATGGWEITAKCKLKQINIELECFPYASSDDHFSRTEILNKSVQRAKQYYGNDFLKIIYVGDGIWDYKAACELNIEFIGIDYTEDGKLSNAGALRIVKDYSEQDTIMDMISSISHKLS